jgi:hypothetical protein
VQNTPSVNFFLEYWTADTKPLSSTPLSETKFGK